MLKTELQKLYGKKLIQILIVIIFLGNGILGYINANVNVKATEANAKAYATLQKDLEMLSDEEKNVYIENGIKYMLAIQSAQIYCLFGYNEADEVYFSEEYPQYSLEECMEAYESGNYLQYTSNMFSELQLYEEVQEEMEVCNTYSDYVQKILDRTLSLLKKTKNQDSYMFRNLAETYFSFETVKDVQTSYGPSRGVEFLCNNLTTDLWALLFIFMVTVLLVTTEREKGLLVLVKSTKHGRSKLAISKLLILYSACLVAMLLHIENFILAESIYGIGDLGRSIQSVVGYQGCTLPVSVGVFLVLGFLLKLLVYMGCASFVFAICAFSMKSIWVYIVTIGVAVISGIIYTSIDSNSNIALLKEVTPMALLKINDILGNYKNLQFGNLALNRCILSVVLIIIVCLESAIFGVIVFSKRNEKKSKNAIFSIRVFKKIMQKFSIILEKHTSSFCHELYRVFIVQHGLFILVFAGLFIYQTFEPINAISRGDEGIYYDTFITNVIGPADEISEDYWDNLKQQYNEVYENASTEGNIQKTKSAENALRAIESLKQHSLYLEKKPESWYLCDVGYGVLTDSDNSYENAERSSVLFIILVGIMCFVGIYSLDYQNDGIRLLRTTKYGRERLTINKVLIGSMIAVVISLFAWLPQLRYILQTFGTVGIEAPAYSMEHLSWLPQWMRIKDYLILIYAIRFIGTITMMLLIFAITIRFRSFIISVSISFAVILLPVGLNMLGVDFMKYVLLTPMLMGNPMFISGNIAIVVVCFIQEIIILGVSIATIKIFE